MLEDILVTIIEMLEKNEIDYMITGSFASNLHGVPRTTLDADIVVSADFEKIKSFIEKIKDDFYADLDMARNSFEQKRMFNIIHFNTGFKVDFIFRKSEHFYEEEFKRRKRYHFANRLCFFASPEDTILSKLVWSKKSESERQFRDALGVAKIQKDKLDYEYLKKLAVTINVNDLLERIFKEIGI